MTFGVNTSPLSGRDGKYLTIRQIKARLDREVLGNVSIEVLPTELAGDVRGPWPRASSSWRCSSSRCVARASSSRSSRPEVLLHEVDGEVQEPYERITIDIPPELHRRRSASRWRRARRASSR